MMRSTILILSTTLILLACGNDGDGRPGGGGGDDNNGDGCVPGNMTPCACEDGREGAQTCDDGGMRYEPCVCEGDGGEGEGGVEGEGEREDGGRLLRLYEGRTSGRNWTRLWTPTTGHTVLFRSDDGLLHRGDPEAASSAVLGPTSDLVFDLMRAWDGQVVYPLSDGVFVSDGDGAGGRRIVPGGARTNSETSGADAWLVAGGSDGHLWAYRSGAERAVDMGVTQLGYAWSAAGPRTLFPGWLADGTFGMILAEPGADASRVSPLVPGGRSFGFFDGGRLAYAAGGDPPEVQILSVDAQDALLARIALHECISRCDGQVAVSPDGRWLAASLLAAPEGREWQTGDIGLYDAQSGTTRRIERQNRERGRVRFLVHRNRMLFTDGRILRFLDPGEDAEPVEVAATGGSHALGCPSPDGSYLVVEPRDAEAESVLLVHPDGAVARVLPRGVLFHCDESALPDPFRSPFSPDGAFFRFLRSRRPDGVQEQEILTLATGATQEAGVVPATGNLGSMWTPDSRVVTVRDWNGATGAATLVLLDPATGQERLLGEGVRGWMFDNRDRDAVEWTRRILFWTAEGVAWADLDDGEIHRVLADVGSCANSAVLFALPGATDVGY